MSEARGGTAGTGRIRSDQPGCNESQNAIFPVYTHASFWYH